MVKSHISNAVDSLDSVYLEIKFAHKLDAPAALSVKQEELSVSEDRVALVASQGHKKYSFNLQFHDSIDPEVCHKNIWASSTILLSL